MERYAAKKLSKNRLTAFIELGRPWNGIITAIFAMLGCLLGGSRSLFLLIVSATVVFLLYLGAAALNDIFDVDVDLINMPYRPLERKQLTVREASSFSILLYMVASAASLLLSLLYFTTIVLMVILSYVYSARPFSANRRGILGNIVLACTSVLAPAYSGYVLAGESFVLSSRFLLLLVPLTVFFLFFTLIKDFKDFLGDSAKAKRTCVVIWGLRKTALVIFLGTLITFPIVICVSYIVSENLTGLISEVFLFCLLLWSEFKILKDPTLAVSEKQWGISRLVMFVFSLTILATTYFV